MPINNPLSNPAGTDGIVPVYEPEGRFTIWALVQVYLGGVGAGKYVPKVGDYVEDTDTGVRYHVVALDLSTYVPQLVEVRRNEAISTLSENDILLGAGPSASTDNTYRLLVDKSVIPYTLDVDNRLHVHGSLTQSAKIYRGSELEGTLVPISLVFDASGNLLGNEIPLELVAMPNQTNLAIKAVGTAYTNADLQDGEVCTVILFSDTGHVVSKRQLLVNNTAFIRSANAEVKYVIGISLESPFLSQADPMLIQYPLNVPLNGLNLTGVVHYSDGSSARLPVDGTKFSVLGLQSFVATQAGQKFKIVIKYVFSPGEVGYGQTVGMGSQFISQTYRVVALQREGSYSVKLFGYPVWVDTATGYRLEWFLYNLDRQESYNVTNLVRINQNGQAFSPRAYGVNQNLNVSVNLRDVNGAFKSYIHTQTIDIVLLTPGTERITNWTVGFDPGQNPPYGMNNFASSVFIDAGNYRVSVGLSATTLAAWLERIYYQTKPLVNDTTESLPPAPNFFAFVFGDVEVEFPIAQWNTEHVIGQSLVNNGTLFIKFFLRTVVSDIQLSVAALPIYQQN